MMSPDGLKSRLTRAERAALAICDFANRDARAKAAQTFWQRHVADELVHAIVASRLRVFGLEHAAGLNPDRGVLLCANHRSFFDQWAIMSCLYRQASWARRCYFPVRSNFFYDSWSGVLVNALLGGFVMWPPLFRD